MILLHSTPKPGEWARYHLVSAREKVNLSVKMITITVGPEEKGHRWWQISAMKQDGSTFAVRLLSESVSMIGTDGSIGSIDRYIFKDGDRPWIEYRDKSNGKALLPKFDFHERLLPRPTPGTTFTGPFANTGIYLGHGLELEETGDGEHFDPQVEAQVISLDPNLIIGTARTFRDTDGQRRTENDKTRRDLLPEDYDELVSAGFNFFITNGTERELLVWERPAFYNKYPEANDFPNILYRSNYTGCVMFNDEPAVLTNFNPCTRVTDAANLLRLRVAETLMGNAQYGSKLMMHRWEGLGICLGTWDLIDRDIPCWDAVCETAYYQVEAGSSGMIHEGMYHLDTYNTNLQSVLGPGVEVTAKEMLELHYAFMRGAARCFDRNWGMSIYGQADPKLSPLATKMAYDMGARYIWYWTEGEHYHLPFVEQVDLTRQIREHEKAHPRPAMSKLLRAADTAIVFPEGYTYFGSSRLVWHSGGMPQDALNEAGVPHRFVMARAMWEAIKLIRQGVSFDFVVDGKPARKAGYKSLITVCRDGTVKEEKASGDAKKTDISARFLPPPSQPKIPGAAPRISAHFIAPGSVKIDGDLSDWQRAEWLDLSSPQHYTAVDGTVETHLVAIDSAVKTNISARVAFGFNGESLYLAAEVQDDEHHNNRDRWGMWKGDSIRLAIDPYMDRSASSYKDDDLEFGIALREGKVDSYRWCGNMAGFAGPFRKADIAIKRDGTVTRYEARIPLAELIPLSPALQPTSGLCVMVNQATASGLIGYLAWTPGAGQIEHPDPSQFGVIEFRGAVESLDRPIAQFSTNILVAEPNRPIVLKMHAAASKATPAVVSISLTSGDLTSHSEAGVKLPASRSNFELAIPRGLSSGEYTGEIILSSIEGDVFARSSLQILVW